MFEDNTAVIQQFADGLVMRRATLDDVDRLAEFNGEIHGDNPADARAVASWVRDLLIGPHPTFQTGDFLIVEDPASGKIVSSLCTISQTWAYENISFGVGRPELVGTAPEFRNRGLVRAQFDVIHEWSRQRGELIQVITGIPFYYRQFGYEMALDLGGGWAGYESHLPVLADGQEEKYLFRPALESDLLWLLKMVQRDCSRSALCAVRDLDGLRNELLEKSHENVNRVDIRVIETREGRPAGYLAYPWYTWDAMQVAKRYELDEGFSYLDVTPSVIRYLWKVGIENAALRQKKLNAFGLWLGGDHPAYQAVAGRLVKKNDPYAFYIRVPDLSVFISQIAPALEKRLCDSPYAGHTGELKISFYRGGLRLVFDQGILTLVENWKPGLHG